MYVYMYTLTTDQSGIHACIHICKYSSTCHFFMGPSFQRGMQTPMHPCIYALSEQPFPWMHSRIHPGVCGCSHTFVHPIPDLRLSSFSACTFSFFWFHKFWLCSKTHTFSTVSSLPILLIVLISRQQSQRKEFQPHMSLWTPPYLPSIPDAQFLENSVHSCCHPLAFRFHPTWLLWLGLAPLHGKCSCWGISCQGLSNGLDKGVYLFIPAEALDWSWSLCVDRYECRSRSLGPLEEQLYTIGCWALSNPGTSHVSKLCIPSQCDLLSTSFPECQLPQNSDLLLPSAPRSASALQTSGKWMTEYPLYGRCVILCLLEQAHSGGIFSQGIRILDIKIQLRTAVQASQRPGS